MILPDFLERDLRPFADPATEVEVLANEQTIRILLTRDGEGHSITLSADSGHVRLQTAQEGEPVTRDFPNLRSLLASQYFSSVQVLADNQRRLLDSQRVSTFIEPEGEIDGEPLTLTTFQQLASLRERELHDKPIRLILLALLWQILWVGVSDEFIAVGASTGWWSHEEVENGLPDGRHGRLRRWSPDSFFSVPLP